MENFPYIPEQPEDYEQGRQIDALNQDCQDLLEQDERYRNQEKTMRSVSARWSTGEGLHFEAQVSGRHTYLREHERYVGQAFELNFQVTYPVRGIVPTELVQQAAAQQEVLPEPETIYDIETHYLISFTIEPTGGFGWHERRIYDICFETDEDDDAGSFVAMDASDEGLAMELQKVAETEYVCELSYQSSGGFEAAAGEADARDPLAAFEAMAAGLERGVYLELAQQVMAIFQSEDEGSLGLNRVFPEEIVNKILQIQ